MVIAILGVLSAIAIPVIGLYLGQSKERAYNADRERIQQAVDAFFSENSNIDFVGKPQYPILGMDRTQLGFIRAHTDHDTEADKHEHHDEGHEPADSFSNRDHTIIGEAPAEGLGNPRGGTQGGNPRWTDDGNGIRDPDEEELLDDDAVSQDKPGWHVARVTRGLAIYIVDTRNYFIDFDKVVAMRLLDQVPSSASPDNKPDGSSTGIYDGSYSWYVDPDGKVKSLFFFLPASDSTGFQTAYP